MIKKSPIPRAKRKSGGISDSEVPPVSALNDSQGGGSMDTTGEVRLVSLCAVTWHDGVQLHAATSDGCVYGYDDKRDAWDAMAPVPGTVAALATPATPAAAEPVSDTAQLGL